jgi:hypothetical protein
VVVLEPLSHEMVEVPLTQYHEVVKTPPWVGAAGGSSAAAMPGIGSAGMMPASLPVQDALQTFSREIARDFSLKSNRGMDLGAEERAPPF